MNSIALRATTLLCAAEDERRTRAASVAAARHELVEGLARLPVEVWESPANFLLLRADVPDLRERLLDLDIAVRRAKTFPGLDSHYVRLAVHPDPDARARLLAGLLEVLGDRPAPRTARRPRLAASRTLIIGGARSGKSRHAQQLLAHEPEVLYVAPGPVPDEEDADWAARVAAHQLNRPATWTTLETRDVGSAHRGDNSRARRLPRHLARRDHVGGRRLGLGGRRHEVAARARPGGRPPARGLALVSVPVVAVSNEVGSGVVPSTRAGVLFRDALGRLNQRLASIRRRPSRGGRTGPTAPRRNLMTSVTGPDDEARAAARLRLDALAKPLGALGRLEDLAVWLAGVQGTAAPRPPESVSVVLFAGDHGVTSGDRAVSAYPRDVTAMMVHEFLRGGAAVNVLARAHDARVRVVDLGVDADLLDTPPEVVKHKVRRSSGAIDREDALTVEDTEAALVAGATIADEEIDAGADLLVPGDMGIGNTTVVAALVGAALGLAPTTWSGGAPASTMRRGRASSRWSTPPWPGPGGTATTPSPCCA